MHSTYDTCFLSPCGEPQVWNVRTKSSNMHGACHAICMCRNQKKHHNTWGGNQGHALREVAPTSKLANQHLSAEAAAARATAAAPPGVLKILLKGRLTFTNISLFSALAMRWRQAKSFALLSLMRLIVCRCSFRALCRTCATSAANEASLALARHLPSTAAAIPGYI